MPKQITSVEEYLSCDSSTLADTYFNCPECGRVHSIPIKAMKVGRGLVDEIPRFIADALRRAPRLVCVIFDRAIESLVQNQVLLPLVNTGLPLEYIPVGAAGILLDSEVNLCDATAGRVNPEADYIIGVGSGVISDLTKWVATRRNLPFLLFATAPSMNAYSSITATMTEADIKTSRLLNPASAVFMDIDIQASAPMEMIHAGIGDLAARAICNADWKLASCLHGAYFCPIPYRLTHDNERKYLAAASDIGQRKPAAIAHLSEAILMSGLSMTVLEGETSPSSGAEHVISHFWDLLTHLRGLPKNLHGTQVGIGTVIMLAFYEIMRGWHVQKINPISLLRSRQSVESIEAENIRLYGSAAPLFNAVVRKKRIPDDQFCDEVRRIQSGWDDLWEAANPYIAPLDSIRKPLHSAGMPLTLASIGRTPDEAVEALVKGPQYRSRFTLLDLASEFGLLPEIAPEVLARAGV